MGRDRCQSRVRDADGTILECSWTAGHERRGVPAHYDAAEDVSWTFAKGLPWLWDQDIACPTTQRAGRPLS
jgi:hypothetical protein